MASPAQVDADQAFRVVEQQTLFRVPAIPSLLLVGADLYDVSPDDQRNSDALDRGAR